MSRRAVLGLLLALSGCVSAPRGAETEVRRVVEEFLAAVNAADTDRFMDFFAADATAFFPSNASAARRRGIEQIRQAIEPAFAQGPRSPPARSDDLVITLHQGLAVASFDAGSGVLHARRTLVLKRSMSHWWIVHIHASNVSEAP